MPRPPVFPHRRLVASAAFVAATAFALPALAGETDVAALMSGGILWALGAMLGAGLLTAATPCVFPLIPITVAIFGARDASSRGQAAMLSGAYVLGIAVMYTGLGIFAGLSGGVFGSFMANPIMMGAVALVFLAMSASMFGAFDIALPMSLQQKLNQVGGVGYGGAFSMGLVSGIIAAPCTGPALVGVLTYVATTGDALLGGSLLFVYALGMGLPFFLVGTFAVSLPKSGPWMDGVKSVFGVVMLVAALYFLQNAFGPVKSLFVAGDGLLWPALGALAAGVALGAVHLTFKYTSWVNRMRKGVGVLACVAGAVLLIGDLENDAKAATVAWEKNHDTALALARESGKPVMIDFWADWCKACKELDKHTFTDDGIIAEADRFVPIKVDATNETDEIERLQERYNIAGLPTVVFIDSKGEVMEDPRVTGFVEAPKFLPLMQKVQ